MHVNVMYNLLSLLFLILRDIYCQKMTNNLSSDILTLLMCDIWVLFMTWMKWRVPVCWQHMLRMIDFIWRGHIFDMLPTYILMLDLLDHFAILCTSQHIFPAAETLSSSAFCMIYIFSPWFLLWMRLRFSHMNSLKCKEFHSNATHTF